MSFSQGFKSGLSVTYGLKTVVSYISSSFMVISGGKVILVPAHPQCLGMEVTSKLFDGEGGTYLHLLPPHPP